MFYGDSVQDTRQMFYSSWQKYQQKQALMPLEQQIINVIIDHPEYHSLFEKDWTANDKPYFPDMGQTNPFLHMGLHLAVRDQVSMNQPAGILTIYQRLLKHYADVLSVEHMLMENLAECLWVAQRDRCAPDEQQYFQALMRLLPSENK